MKPSASRESSAPIAAALPASSTTRAASNGRPPVDLPRIERAVREILAAVGEDPDREGLRETPARVARMYRELFSGLHADPRVHLQKFFTEKYDEMVLVKDIAFNSMCEHHMLPFIGKAHIGYVPNGKVVGLSKLARVVEEVSHRPQVQERMTEQIANLLVEELRREGRGRGDRGVALVHVDPRRAEAGERVRHLGDEGDLPLEPVEPVGSDDADLRRSAVSACGSRIAWRCSPNSCCGCRSAWPRAMALVSPRQVTSGYFRNHLYVTLGLSLAGGAAEPGGDAAGVLAGVATAAALSYVGSVCWLYEKPRVGQGGARGRRGGGAGRR